MREESDAEYEDGDPFAGLYPTKKVEQWDCDTIISMICFFPSPLQVIYVIIPRHILKLGESP